MTEYRNCRLAKLVFPAFPMTATHLPLQRTGPSHSGLVCRPLIAMASRGFDPACLLQMQDAAFRLAAQLPQNNKPEQIWRMEVMAAVDKQLGGIGSGGTAVLPGHIAAYMAAKARISQFPQRQVMFNVSVLAECAIRDSPTAAVARDNWLAANLVSLKRDAERLAVNTPIFAAEIAGLVAAVLARESNCAGFLSALQVAKASPERFEADEEMLEADLVAAVSRGS